MILNIFQKFKTAEGFLLVFLFFALTVALSYKNTASLMAASEERKHAAEMLSTLGGLYSSLGDMESTEKDYLNSGRETDPLSYFSAEKRAVDVIGALKILTRDHPDQQRRLIRLQPLVAERMNVIRQVINANQREGPTATDKLIQAGSGEQLTEEIRNIISEMSDAQKEHLRQLDMAVSAGARDTRYIVVFGSLMGAIVVVLSLVLSRRELAQRKKAEESVKVLSTSMEQATDLVMVTNAEGTIEYVNKAVEETTGYPVAKLIGKSWEILKSEKEGDTFFKKVQETLRSGRSFQAEVVKRKKSGELFSLHETVTPIMEKEGNIAHFISTGKDITFQKSLEEKVDHLTHYDALTGLPKRDLFVDRLSQEIERAKKDSGIIAVLIMDIDRFKLMNDVFGFDTGDEIVKVVAARLTDSLGESALVARIGSDEFGAIVGSLATAADAVPVADRMLKNVSRPITVREEEIFVTLGVGIALYPGNGEDAATLMKNAGVALSQAKYQGRNNYQFYSKDISLKASERLILENNLFTALNNKEYLLNYQPYHELIAKKIAGAEALIRWKHAKLGLVSPAEFIPTLEETGMIIAVGEWVLRTACQQLKEWDTRRSFFPISVNLSGNQFRHKYLVNMVDSAIKDFNLDPSHLTLEVTESTFMHDLDSACAVLKKLKDIGISISVDDFGTGYSSLSYLKKLPVDNVKIDRSFVKDVATDPDSASVVTAIVTMARSLNLKTIAEGIENEEQLKVLRLLRCDMGQGYYFSRPLSPEEIEKYFY